MAESDRDEASESGDGNRRAEGEPARPRTPILLSNARPTPPPAPAPRPIPLQDVAQPPPLRPQSAPVPVAAPLAAMASDAVLAEGVVYTGAVLKAAREARGLSLEQVCDRTRIPRQHVGNLEADRYDQLPPPVYLRGILMALAKELRLDGQKVSRSYLAALAGATRDRAR